jgi:Na+-transporting methylmalonyl-CoA/oxaloacetate decarboxylase beta subunit
LSIFLGLIAFILSTVTGLLLAKIMKLFSKEKINPLLGVAGVPYRQAAFVTLLPNPYAL